MDAATGLVTVPAGMRLHELNHRLWAAGLALTNLGDIDVQTVAGAIVHRHARHRRAAAAAWPPRCAGWSWSPPTARSCAARPTERPELFAAARVGLGALGVVTAVTLQCEPAFALHAQEGAMPLAEVLADFDGVRRAQRPLRVLLVPAHRHGA